ncbi:hypothetical protein LCGC14_2922960, partial [marine sediment metagenome]
TAPRKIYSQSKIRNKRPAADGPGSFYIQIDTRIYEADFEVKMGLSANPNRRRSEARTYGNFDYEAHGGIIVWVNNMEKFEDVMLVHFHEFQIPDPHSKERFILDPTALGNAKMWAQMMAVSEEFCPTALQLENFIS